MAALTAGVAGAVSATAASPAVPAQAPAVVSAAPADTTQTTHLTESAALKAAQGIGVAGAPSGAQDESFAAAGPAALGH